MSCQKLLPLVIGLTLVVLFLIACAAPPATQALPTPEPEVTATQVPVIATSVPTDTPIPPSPQQLPPPTFAPEAWLLQGRVISDFTSVCDLSQPELQPQDVRATYAPGAKLAWVGCETLDEELQDPLAIIINFENSTEISHTLMIPLPSDVNIHTQAESKSAAAIYYQGWAKSEKVKLEKDVEPGAAVELLYLIPQFSGEATIEFMNIGSFKIEGLMPSVPTTSTESKLMCSADSRGWSVEITGESGPVQSTTSCWLTEDSELGLTVNRCEGTFAYEQSGNTYTAVVRTWACKPKDLVTYCIIADVSGGILGDSTQRCKNF